MSNAWYPRYTGDFIRDTSHLSLVEVGAYNRILDHYYASSGPLCMTEAQVMRLCAAVTPEECEAVKYVLSAYFVFEPEDGCYHNPRADKELSSMAEHHSRLSEAGRKGGLKSVQARLEAGLKRGYKRGYKRGASISTITTTTTSTSTSTTLSGLLLESMSRASGRKLVSTVADSKAGIEKLLKSGITEETIRATITWLEHENPKREKPFVVLSGASLHEKWDRIQSAMNSRPKSNQPPPMRDLRDIQ